LLNRANEEASCEIVENDIGSINQIAKLKTIPIKGVNMSKHHHQSKAEQINNKVHDTAQLQQNKMFYQKSEPIKPENTQIKAAIEESSIQQRAYQIHSEKGGSPLENWLEAEQTLRNNDSDHLSLINEGSPSTFQKRNGKTAKVDLYR